MEILGLIDVPTWLILFLTCVVLLYIYGTWNYNVFSSQGIPGPTPWPFVGNVPEMLSKGESLAYTDFEKKYGKVYSLVTWNPILVVTDLDMVKEVMVKQFPKFSDRNMSSFFSSKVLDKSVAFAKGSAWKRIRRLMTPAFNSSKLKLMGHFMDRCSKLLMKNIEQHVQEDKVLDVKEIFGAFTMDIIAGTAFGLETNSQTEKEEPFLARARTVFVEAKLKEIGNLLMYLTVMFPFLGRVLRSFRPSNNVRNINFFACAIEQMIDAYQAEGRKQDEKKANMIQLLVNAEADPENIADIPDASDGTKSHKRLTKEEIAAQGVTVFLAGYETTAIILQYLTYKLAVNPDVQEKLYEEIIEHIGQEDPTHEKLTTLKYLDAVINETLRLFPVFTSVDRKARETTDVNGVVIPKGCGVTIPIYAILHNPENFSDPDVFNPERDREGKASKGEEMGTALTMLAQEKFLGENREKLESILVDIPFGFGPRQCLGMRLARMEMKFAIVSICRAFRFIKCKDTPEKIKIGYIFNMAVPDKSIIIKAERRLLETEM